MEDEASQPCGRISSEDKALLIAGLEHCTKWVEFRTNHQALTFNGYLVAVGFLAAGYFATVSAHLKLIAVAIAATGIISSLAFAYAVARLINYVDVGEDALRRLESRLATNLDLQEIRLVERAKRNQGILSRTVVAIVGYLTVVALWVTAGVFALL